VKKKFKEKKPSIHFITPVGLRENKRHNDKNNKVLSKEEIIKEEKRKF